MKKVLMFLLFTTLLVNTSFAQEKVCDLELSFIDVNEDNYVPYGDTAFIEITIKNHGPDDIEEGDEIWIDLIGFPSNSLLNSIDIPMGEAFTFLMLSGSAGINQFDNETTEFCAELIESEYYNDPNSENNNTCISVTLEGSHVLSIDENESDVFVLYPNPVKSSMPLKIKSNNSTLDFSNVKIINVLGQVVLETEISQNQIDLSGLSEGLYYVEIFEENTGIKQLKKLMIQ